MTQNIKFLCKYVEISHQKMYYRHKYFTCFLQTNIQKGDEIMKKKFLHLKVGDKLKKAFTRILSMFVIAIIVSVVCSFGVILSFKAFYSDAYANTVTQLGIQRDVQMIGKLVVLAIQTDNAEESSKYISVATQKVQSVMDSNNVLLQNFSNKKLTNQLSVELIGLKKAIGAVGTELVAGNKENAFAVYDSEYYTISDNITTTLTSIGEECDANALKEINLSTYLGLGSMGIMLVLGIISIAFSVSIAKMLTKMITTPINELKEATGKMRNGKLDISIDYESEDEFGELAADFTYTCETLHTIIEDTGHLLGEMSEGNFNVDSHIEERYVGDFSALLDNIRKLNIQLNITLKQINEVSEQVAIGSGQLAEGSQTLAEGATDQAGAVQELTATIENVTNIAAGSAEAATQAASQVSAAAADAAKSREEIQALTAAMDRITETSREIENIIGSIEDIAEQTNLLSLNASIEAARAGEAGRGFAVVADQIGKLASDSAASAISTKDLINKAIAEIENGNSITLRTAETINLVLESMSTFAQAAAGSAEESRSQADMLKQIEAGIEQISGVVENNSANAEETSAVSEELSAQAESLKEMVARFRLRDDATTYTETFSEDDLL